MTHSIIRVEIGKVKWEGLQPFTSKIKVRETQYISYFIKEDGRNIGLSESLFLDPTYRPDKKRFREVRTRRKVQYENILNTGEKVWWNPTGKTQVILNSSFRKPESKPYQIMNRKEIVKKWNALPWEKRLVLSNQALRELNKDYVEPWEVYKVNKFKIKDKN